MLNLLRVTTDNESLLSSVGHRSLRQQQARLGSVRILYSLEYPLLSEGEMFREQEQSTSYVQEDT